ncbi:MAG: hypothetical protein Q9180_003374, partial [Flavoplaca navasiana]
MQTKMCIDGGRSTCPYEVTASKKVKYLRNASKEPPLARRLGPDYSPPQMAADILFLGLRLHGFKIDAIPQWSASESTSTGWSSQSDVDLYLKNLPDKLHKNDLRVSLYTLFSTYGPVLDVVALKTKQMRGQAHVVFRDVQASTQAMRALQDFEFFGKEI